MPISYVTSAGIQGAITAGTAFSAQTTSNITFNGTTTMTVNSVSAGAIVIGQVLNVSPYPTVTAQLTGTTGGAGTYTISAAVNAATYTINAAGFDFLNVPSWARRITIVCDSMSNANGYAFAVQAGTASGVASSGYVGNVYQWYNGSSNSTTASNYFFLVYYGNPSARYNGTLVFTLVGSNIWAFQSQLGDGFGANSIAWSAGRVALSGALTTVRLLPTQTPGTDYFDNGTLNILYE